MAGTAAQEEGAVPRAGVGSVMIVFFGAARVSVRRIRARRRVRYSLSGSQLGQCNRGKFGSVSRKCIGKACAEQSFTMSTFENMVPLIEIHQNHLR